MTDVEGRGYDALKITADINFNNMTKGLDGLSPQQIANLEILSRVQAATFPSLNETNFETFNKDRALTLSGFPADSLRDVSDQFDIDLEWLKTGEVPGKSMMSEEPASVAITVTPKTSISPLEPHGRINGVREHDVSQPNGMLKG